LLAAATVVTAWIGHQASRWNSEATKATMRGNTARLQATQQANLANAQAGIDVALFNWPTRTRTARSGYATSMSGASARSSGPRSSPGSLRSRRTHAPR
jgi:hypothetical protein